MLYLTGGKKKNMLDWMFILFLMLALLFLFLSIFIPEEKYEEPYWKILSVAISGGIWFILALFNLDIQTAYPCFNSTTGNTTLQYSTYVNEGGIFLSYFYGLMGCLCMIYMIVLIFGYYYEKLDEKQEQQWKDSGE
jgi:RsiW-degrading membrane proteinase PrsW (M82 family)